MLVALGIIVLRRKDPDRPRPFRTPWVPFLPLVSIGFCVYLILSLPLLTKLRFVAWLAVGGLIYFLYSVRHSRVRRLGLDPQGSSTPKTSFGWAQARRAACWPTRSPGGPGGCGGCTSARPRLLPAWAGVA